MWCHKCSFEKWMSPLVDFHYSWCFKERPFSKLVTYSPQDNGAVFYIIIMKINMDSGGERKPEKSQGRRDHLLRTDILKKQCIIDLTD